MPEPTLTRYFAYDAEVDGDGTYVTFEEADRLIQALREELATTRELRQACREVLATRDSEVQALRQELEEARQGGVMGESCGIHGWRAAPGYPCPMCHAAKPNAYDALEADERERASIRLRDLARVEAENDALRAEVGALRRALDAAQRQHTRLRDWLTTAIETLDWQDVTAAVQEFLKADAENLAAAARPQEP